MIQIPSQTQAIGADAGPWNRAWYEWAWNLTGAANRDLGTGTAAQRPNTSVAGAHYFDTTAGRPIWWDGALWVYADGTPA